MTPGDDMPDALNTKAGRIVQAQVEREEAKSMQFIAGDNVFPSEGNPHMPDAKQWALQFGRNTFHLTMPEMIADVHKLMARCYLHAASVAREHNCDSGNSWCPCEIANRLESIAQGLEKGEPA